MFAPSYTTQFKRDLKKMQKQGKDVEKIKAVIDSLCAGVALDAKHRNHTLGGDWKNHWECHIEPNWLLIYYYPSAEEILFVRTGSHSDLFS